MAIYSSGNGKKIILLILFIIILFAAGILLVDFVGSIFGVYFPIPGLKQIKQITFNNKLKISENPYLLEREELDKDRERLGLFEEEINIRKKEVEAKEIEANKNLNSLKEKETELEKKEKMLVDRENLYNDKKKNIREQAEKIYNMPPKDAVSLLEKQTEADIVEILREIDVLSTELGKNSISPYLLKLMGDLNKEKAANVLRKLKYSGGEKDTSVEMLDENEINFDENKTKTKEIPNP